MNWKEYIQTNEEILGGKPTIRETRISVEHIIKLLASGWSENDIFENYPNLTKTSLQAVFAYIQELIQDGFIYNNPLKSA
jgi:uncharacterized protein (DUF433 family)